MPIRRTVAAPVTNLWSSPSAVRDVDAAMLGDQPDVVGWLDDLDATDSPEHGRAGLHGRLLTQLSRGEPVDVGPADSAPDGWVPVTCPWQPSHTGSGAPGGGYPGWVLAAHLRPPADAPAEGSPRALAPRAPDAPETDETELAPGLLDAARQYLGVPYLWGGCCALALDCSGLVHWAARSLGAVVPRDADDQYDASKPLAVEYARPGDLLFFAGPSGRPHHVGILSAPGRMLHAPETGAVVVEQELGEDRKVSLLGAGRLW